MREYPMSKDRVHIQTIIRETERKKCIYVDNSDKYRYLILKSESRGTEC